MGSDDGAVTVEAAFALASIVTVLVLCLGAVLSVTSHLRCQDAAREVVRLVARGDAERAGSVAAQVAPSGAVVEWTTEGDVVRAVVSVGAPLLPAVTVSGSALAVVEPGVVGVAGGTGE